MFCWNCGNELNKDAQFCKMCGSQTAKPLAGIADSAPATETSQASGGVDASQSVDQNVSFIAIVSGVFLWLLWMLIKLIAFLAVCYLGIWVIFGLFKWIDTTVRPPTDSAAATRANSSGTSIYRDIDELRRLRSIPLDLNARPSEKIRDRDKLLKIEDRIKMQLDRLIKASNDLRWDVPREELFVEFYQAIPLTVTRSNNRGRPYDNFVPTGNGNFRNNGVDYSADEGIRCTIPSMYEGGNSGYMPVLFWNYGSIFVDCLESNRRK